MARSFRGALPPKIDLRSRNYFSSAFVGVSYDYTVAWTLSFSSFPVFSSLAYSHSTFQLVYGTDLRLENPVRHTAAQFGMNRYD
jgi:hypothetical protein